MITAAPALTRDNVSALRTALVCMTRIPGVAVTVHGVQVTVERDGLARRDVLRAQQTCQCGYLVRSNPIEDANDWRCWMEGGHRAAHECGWLSGT